MKPLDIWIYNLLGFLYKHPRTDIRFRLQNCPHLHSFP